MMCCTDVHYICSGHTHCTPFSIFDDSNFNDSIALQDMCALHKAKPTGNTRLRFSAGGRVQSDLLAPLLVTLASQASSRVAEGTLTEQAGKEDGKVQLCLITTRPELTLLAVLEQSQNTNMAGSLKLLAPHAGSLKLYVGRATSRTLPCPQLMLHVALIVCPSEQTFSPLIETLQII